VFSCMAERAFPVPPLVRRIKPLRHTPPYF
jgi:hypothetical protein